MNKRHQQTHECHCSRWEQCRVKRLRRDIREKYHCQAYRSPSPERLFYQERIIFPNIHRHMQLIPSPNDLLCKSAALGQGAQPENYKLIIKSANLIIRTKKLTSTSHKALLNFILQNMVHHLSRVQMKHFLISAKQTSINFNNCFTNALPDLVVVGLVSDADLAVGYQRNPFNFHNGQARAIL